MSDERQRIDKWLWHARFFKTRSLATRLCGAGRLRLNRTPISKAHAMVGPGDVLTFPHGNLIRVVKIVALGERRGPASSARTLYEDLAPPLERSPRTQSAGETGSRSAGRRTKADRRRAIRLKRRD